MAWSERRRRRVDATTPRLRWCGADAIGASRGDEPKSSVVVGYRYYAIQARDSKLEVQRVLDDHGPRAVHDDLDVGRVRGAGDVVEDLAVGVAVLLEEVAEEVVDARGVVVRRPVVTSSLLKK